MFDPLSALLHTHFLSVMSFPLCDSTPSKFLESSFPRSPRAAPFLRPCTCFLFFLFLVLVKSGMARVFHHRNRHNRPTQPSTGSANRDQIKSIIQPVCAKAFFLPLALLQALEPYLRAVPAGRGGTTGGGVKKVLNTDVIWKVKCWRE